MNYKKILLIFGAILSILLLYFFICSNTKDSIEVNGECITSLKQDRTAINLRIVSLEKTESQSLQKANETSKKIITLLETEDVKFQTERFDSYEKVDWENNKRKKIGYETTIVLEISADTTEKIEKVINKFMNVNNIFFEQFRLYSSSENTKNTITNCLAEATNNAKERAEKIAKSQNRKLGKLTKAIYGTNSSYDNDNYSNYIYKGFNLKESFDVASKSSALASKDTVIKINISATFQLK